MPPDFSMDVDEWQAASEEKIMVAQHGACWPPVLLM
jgi:hypothetical protein